MTTDSRAPDNGNHVAALARYIAASGWIKFREMNHFLAQRGITTDAGGRELTGEHVRQAHVAPSTTLLGPTSREYVEIAESLFQSFPIILMIGDPADFNGDEPWWVTWVGPPPIGDVASLTFPPVNPYVHDIADQAKEAYANGTRILAEMQYRLAELAGIGKLDRAESLSLQHELVKLWEELYSGTLCAVRDSATDDSTWDAADNTYSDGRQVVNQVRTEPWEDSDHCWEHNRCMLSDGAPNEFPLGTVSYIAPRHENPAPREDNGVDGAGLQERLSRHREPPPEP